MVTREISPEAFLVRSQGRQLGWFRSRLNRHQRCGVEPVPGVAPCGRMECTICQPVLHCDATEETPHHTTAFPT